MKTIKGANCLCLALCAFGGLGLEGILAFLIEPLIYGTSINEWSMLQTIAHWVTTCTLWGGVIFYIIWAAKQKYGFNIFIQGEKMKLLQYILVALCLIFMLVTSYMDWNGFKIIKEFHANGLLKFIFQYIYYLFEIVLVTLIIVFGQMAFEKWFRNNKIPYGGIVAALTWGLAHIFTKGSFLTGLVCAISGFIFGITYLLVNRDIKKTYILLFVMFVF